MYQLGDAQATSAACNNMEQVLLMHVQCILTLLISASTDAILCAGAETVLGGSG
jgi:hypothetical protein